ncbi:MAG: hypothetical protein EP335_12045 [Alphaproteobacteria bacterium]|nr:MAG: hypothetical protein EP335_12045 [Alphaproteobacteria bacterium]
MIPVRMILATIAAFALAAPGIAAPMTLASLDGEPTHFLAEKILEEAYAHAGIEVAFVHLPSNRALKESNRGTYDGEVARLPVIEGTYLALVRVPVPLLTIRGYAYGTGPLDDVKQFSDLANRRLGIELGIVVAEKLAADMHPVKLASTEDLVTFLRRGAVDAIFYEGVVDLSGAPYFLPYRSRALHQDTLYHYLHVNHMDRVEIISRALADMQRTGRIDTILAAYQPAAHEILQGSTVTYTGAADR